MKQFFTIIATILFFFSTSKLNAQETRASTLLWRISGNGLQKPSYLFGTMHLKDRRLFFFGDSVYKSIEAVEGFAMELDPNAMMDSLFSKIGDADTTTLLRKLLDEKKFKSVSKKLEKKFGMPADKISRRQLIQEREGWYTRIHNKDDMNSVVDLYLYDIARKQGKWVGGIEDVDDQSGLRDELGKDVNISEYIDDDESDEKRKSYLDKMISVYAAEDIDKIDQLISGSQSEKMRDLLLVNRNIKMALRMDSLSHIRTSFFAVGAAHLPGQTGLIQLLRQKGFSVTPVLSSKKSAPEKYVYDAKEIAWVKFQEPDSAYSVDMPGKASDLKIAEDIIKLKVYADLVSGNFYMTGFSFVSGDDKPEVMTERMLNSFSQKGMQKKESKKIINRGNNGTEIISANDKIYFRIQLFPLGDKMYIVMSGSEKKENLYSKDSERFFSSFVMNTTVKTKPNKWVDFTEATKAFTISFPKKPGIDKIKNETATNIESTTYTAIDIPNNTYYLAVVNESQKGFVMTGDTAIFREKIDYYVKNNAVVKDIRNFVYDGNPAVSFSAQMTKDGTDIVTKLLLVNRDNRYYTIGAVTQKGREDYPDITHFFRSFKFLPYKETSWSQNTGHDAAFSTWSPAVFELQKKEGDVPVTDDNGGDFLSPKSREMEFISYDANVANTWHVNIYPVSKYYHAKDDSSFIAEQLKTYYMDTTAYYAKANPGHYDSLVSLKPVQNGAVKGFEIMVKNAAESYYKRVRILPHGDSSYQLIARATLATLNNTNTNRFFDDFRFANEDIPSTITKSKTALLLGDMTGTDSASREAAWSGMYTAKFDSADLPLLYDAFLKEYAIDSNRYMTVNQKIGNAISSVHDSSTIAFVAKHYMDGTAHSAGLKMDMLEMLAAQKTVSAINTLKSLLLAAPPNAGEPGGFVSELEDSLQLAAMIFPEAGRFLGDSLMGPSMCRLVSRLLDSNLLQHNILAANATGILLTANRQRLQLKTDDYPFDIYYVIDLLGKVNNKQAIGVLNQLLKSASLEIKKNALLGLLKCGQVVSPLELRKIAADKEHRASFYTSLKDMNKEKLFPAEFITQPFFAESYIYEYNQDDDDLGMTASKYAGERVGEINGKDYRFYLYKVTVDNDGEADSHLAICGGFDMNRKNVELKYEDRRIKIFYDEKYSATSVSKLFADFVEAESDKGNH